MSFRIIFAAALMALLVLPASGVTLYNLPDNNLVTASTRLKSGDVKGARDAALLAPPGGLRDFMVGMTSSRLDQWEEAATRLAAAADGFPLLADYALYHQGNALYKLGRFAEAQAPLRKLLKDHSGSRLTRAASTLLGDALYDSGDFKGALALYEQFIEKYPSGTDSLTALFKSALCRVQSGDNAVAVTALRGIWLNNPASTVAEKAAEELQQLAIKGVKIPPYSQQELYKRATKLYDQGKYVQTIKDLNALSKGSISADLAIRVQLKTGQALFKARQYRDAVKTLTDLQAKDLKKELADETRFWLAKALDRSNRDEEAYSTFIKLADYSPASSLADDALLEAAYIRKSEKNWQKELSILKKILATYPETSLQKSVTWEIAWGSFQSKDFVTAAEYFQKLTKSEATRDKALYWYGRALAASGDEKGAQDTFATLLSEFPLGYYALSHKSKVSLKDDITAPPMRELVESIPVPAGQERVKALISLGFHEEAGRELTFQKRPKSQTGFARLYMEMENYAAAINILKQERLRRTDKESIPLWCISYPLAYTDHVTKNAKIWGVQQGLIYSIIRAESSFSPTALSPVGAVGLMQLMPATASAMMKGNRVETSSLTRPELNIRLGSQHLKDLLEMYHGDPVLAIAAYNAGSANVAKWQKSFGTLPRDEFIESIPFGETREYVKKVLAGMEIYQRLYRLGDAPAEKPVSVAVHEIPAG